MRNNTEWLFQTVLWYRGSGYFLPSCKNIIKPNQEFIEPNNSIICIQQIRFLSDLMCGSYYNINKANLPTKWTVCLPNPVINHHLERIIIINLTARAVSERRRSRRWLPYIIRRLHVSNKHYVDSPSHISAGTACGFANNDIAVFRQQNWFTIRYVHALLQTCYVHGDRTRPTWLLLLH